MRILLQNGRVLDPTSGVDDFRDVLIENDRILQVEKKIDSSMADRVIDVTGCFVMPGLVDLHVHFREPGYEYKETIRTGSLAAAHGGVTTVCPMPNTKPVADSVEVYRRIQEIIDRDAVVNVCQVASVTMGQQGVTPTDLKELHKIGVIAISEDGKSVMNSEVYREAMQAAAELGILVMAHCEDINLVHGGTVNLGSKSAELGLAGISNAVEDIIVARDILLAKETGAKLHLCHCSTADSVRMIEEAREAGIAVSGEVCPHHFTLCDEDIPSNNADWKMNPPLRSRHDVEVLKDGLKRGVMEAISTDHAPHSAEEKARPIESAPFGIVGLETSLALSYTELVLGGYLTPLQLVEKMSTNPARILGIDRGTLAVGAVADITVMDPNVTYTIRREDFVSMGKNTPFDGREVTGKVMYTMVGGKLVYEAR